MEESLILLKELLFWDVKDVVIMKMNAREKQVRKKDRGALLD